MKRSEISTDGEIQLPPRTIVGEYEVIRCYMNESEDKLSVAVFIQLSPFYSYYLLNSFLTSLLIVLISFATFFFRIEDFNERIMVSLTTLLVLTGLFTQANSSSVQTSYLRLLDIWYAVLIIFTFLNVVTVAGLNFLQHKLKANGVGCCDLKKHNEVTVAEKKIQKYNCFCFAFLLGGFCIFLFYFALCAADII